MKIEDSLKKFKHIQPDPTYTDYSRRAILASAQLEKLTVRAILMRVFEGAASVALVGLLIFAVGGGFSGSKYLSPVQFSGIDPAALHAEAQAIDMQINLANLTYTSADNAAAAVSTPRMIAAIVPATTTAMQGAVPATSATSTATAGTTATTTTTATTPVVTTPSSSISINEALQKLTQ